ncbi:MAG TPA: haloacid dehalogenase-like hydrolase, partial [Steroidobacteraceae bacterium]|nr:haloacid dehalogenase-like hydrolase [Steroidobacteraceae bacterium]
MKRTRIAGTVVCVAQALGEAATAHASDALPSWNEGAAKQSIVAFVARVTNKDSTEFVTPAERVAVFDNDGTLWAEQPMYVQLLFALDRLRALAPRHPEWKEQEPFAALLKGDVTGALAGGEKAILDIVKVTHAGMTTEEFEGIVSEWIGAARHPATKRRYTQMVYQPMLELLAYLRANGFK